MNSDKLKHTNYDITWAIEGAIASLIKGCHIIGQACQILHIWMKGLRNGAQNTQNFVKFALFARTYYIMYQSA